MSAKGRLQLAGFVLCAACSTAACDEGIRASIVARGVGAPSPSVSALVIPSTLPFQILPVAGCPFSPPFASTFSLLVDGGGGDLFLHEASFQFLDTRGLVSPLLFRRSDLTRLFGTTVVGPGSHRTFAFRAQFGCGFAGSPHQMSARVVLVDRLGASFVKTLSAPMGRF